MYLFCFFFREAASTSTLTSNDCTQLKNAYYRRRLKNRPKLPASIHETIQVLDQLDSDICRKTLSDIAMFTTTPLLQFLCRVEHVFGDGTFKVAPKHFKQLYSLHAWENGHYVPCVFFILPNKKETTYTKMINLLQEECLAIGSTFHPLVVHLDLEMGPMNAFRSACPRTDIKACQFHVAQAWNRHMSTLGLSTVYRGNSETANWLRAVYGLPALAAEEVTDAFDLVLMSEAPTIDENSPLDKFITYLNSEYMQPGSKFPPTLWADQGLILRTTNCCESFHSHFAKDFTSHSPNIFTFLENLNSHIKTTIHVKLRSVYEQVKTAKKERDNLEKKKDVLDKYRNHELSTISFLKSICVNMQPVHTK